MCFYEGLRCDLLNEPVNVSFVPNEVAEGSTYGSANSIYEWSLFCVSHCPADPLHALTVVGAAHYPRELVVEEDGPDIVQVAVQCEETSPSLVRPDLDLVVVTARHEPAQS